MIIFLKVFLAKSWGRVFYLIDKLFNKKIRGVGRVLRLIKEPQIFKFQGLYFYFNPKIAASYALNFSGYSNEPETALFLNRILSKMTESVTFIDVGASVGEFIFTASKYSCVNSCIAFEPMKECAESIKLTSAINNFEKKVHVVVKAVSNKKDRVKISFTMGSPTASSIVNFKEDFHDDTELVDTITVDEEISSKEHNISSNVVMLIDVEGAEKNVLEGSEKLIQDKKPLIRDLSPVSGFLCF